MSSVLSCIALKSYPAYDRAVSKPLLCPYEELIFLLHVSKAHLRSRMEVKVSKEQSCLAFQIFPIFAPLPTHISLSGLLLSRCEPSLLSLACASLPVEKWCITRREQRRWISIPWGTNEYRVSGQGLALTHWKLMVCTAGIHQLSSVVLRGVAVPLSSLTCC